MTPSATWARPRPPRRARSSSTALAPAAGSSAWSQAPAVAGVQKGDRSGRAKKCWVRLGNGPAGHRKSVRVAMAGRRSSCMVGAQADPREGDDARCLTERDKAEGKMEKGEG